ncbi:MAG: alpha/beta fold hydrolase [Ardenticatenaceae bacterium]|nr:alpha/beta fold hydrolase [Ardenticatenaceae bacterium]
MQGAVATPWGGLPATFTAVPPWQPSPTPTSTPTPIPTVIPATPDPYTPYTVVYLSERSYGTGGDLRIEETMGETADFTRYLISYPSDGLTIYGFMNVPKSNGPHAVVLVLHGYWPPADYNTIGYTAPYADALAQAGFIAIHPNYRHHPPTAESANEKENYFRVGYALDVLNLLAQVQRQAGQPGPLATAAAQHIHLFGHSMGGGIALRVLVVGSGVESAVLYGAMSGNEQQNYERIRVWSNQADGDFELSLSAENLARISPINYLEQIQARISIHHGTQDATVPPQWSADLCERLQDLQKTVECFTYAGQPHNFTGAGNQLLIERAIAFFTAAN